jgi:hypothetical protein
MANNPNTRAACHNAQRLGESPAAGHQLADGRGFGRDPFGAQPGSQQGVGFAVGEDVDGQVTGAVCGDQTWQVVSAGDEHHCSRTARQQ